MKKTFFKKTIFLSITLLSILPLFGAKPQDRDLDLYKSTWTELATKAVHLRDEKACLIEENKKLEATIEPRSYQKGMERGRLQGILITAPIVAIGTFLALKALGGARSSYSPYR